MPSDFVIKPFLAAHKAEVVDMLLTEYDEAKEMELLRREYREEGLAEGREEGLAVGREEGRAVGLAEGIVLTCQSLGIDRSETARRVAEASGIALGDAEELVSRLWS